MRCSAAGSAAPFPRLMRPQLLAPIALCLAFADPRCAFASRKAVLFVLDQTTWEELAAAETPGIDRLIAAGAVANLSCVPAHPASRLGAYVSLGAGNRALAPAAGLGALGIEKAGEGLVLPGMANLVAANQRLQRYYALEVGALGQCLHEAGLKTAVVADTMQGAAEAMLIAADASGKVDFGVLPGPPSAEAWHRRLVRALAGADLVVVRIGPRGAGADAAGPEAADALVSRALPELQDDWLVILLSPSPNEDAFDHMTPIVVRSPRHTGGLLRSGTTQRAGIVASLDVAPTMLDYFHLPSPPSFNGRRARAVEARGERIAALVATDARAYEGDRIRALFLPIFGAYMGLVIVLTLVGGTLPGSKWPRPGAQARVLPLVALAAPAAGLLVRLATPARTGEVVLLVLILAVSAGLAAVAVRVRRHALAPVGFLCVLLAAVIVGDAFTGCRLQVASAFGYSPIVGVRFYGLGNEGVALLLGATMMAIACAICPDVPTRRRLTRLARERLWSAAVVSLIATVVIGHPRRGANTGGAIAAVAGFAAFLMVFARVRPSWRAAAAVALLIVVIVGGFVWMDAHRPPDSETHMGRAARAILHGGLPTLKQIILRKLTSNVRVAAWSPWVLPAGPVLLAVIVAALRPIRLVQRAYAAAPSLRPAAIGLVTAAIVGFLFNDSGLPMAGIILSFFILAVSFVTLGPAGERG
jgi:hypothetical protein